jgi:hypothetical protein
MPSIKENNKLNNRKQQSSNSGSTLTTPTDATQSLKREEGNNNNTRDEVEVVVKRTKRRPTKLRLNDILRRIRHLIVEGRSNLEIQDILQLRAHLLHIHGENLSNRSSPVCRTREKTLITEMSIFRDRLLKSYRWVVALADNENIKADTRLEVYQFALEVAVSVLKLELEGPRIIQREVRVEKIFAHSESA